MNSSNTINISNTLFSLLPGFQRTLRTSYGAQPDGSWKFITAAVFLHACRLVVVSSKDLDTNKSAGRFIMRYSLAHLHIVHQYVGKFLNVDVWETCSADVLPFSHVCVWDVYSSLYTARTLSNK